MQGRSIKNKFLNYNYPQRVFGHTVLNYIKNKTQNVTLIIDCPCGNGETTWHISKFENAKILASDISEGSIKIAKQNYTAPNIEFSCNDITKSIDLLANNSVFSLINSLFLFPNAIDVLNALQNKIKQTNSKLVLIVPNTKGKNFEWFQHHSPGENKLILSVDELKPFFEKLDFKVETIQPICYTHHFNRFDTRFFSVFWGLYLNCLNTIQSTLKIGKANYFFIALTA
jgi:SAM-dependent methyltransferase